MKSQNTNSCISIPFSVFTCVYKYVFCFVFIFDNKLYLPRKRWSGMLNWFTFFSSPRIVLTLAFLYLNRNVTEICLIRAMNKDTRIRFYKLFCFIVLDILLLEVNKKKKNWKTFFLICVFFDSLGLFVSFLKLKKNVVESIVQIFNSKVSRSSFRNLNVNS